MKPLQLGSSSSVFGSAKAPFDKLGGFRVTGLEFIGLGAAEWLNLVVGKAAELELAEPSSLLSGEPSPS